jgi:hypothetical protein
MDACAEFLELGRGIGNGRAGRSAAWVTAPAMQIDSVCSSAALRRHGESLSIYLERIPMWLVGKSGACQPKGSKAVRSTYGRIEELSGKQHGAGVVDPSQPE